MPDSIDKVSNVVLFPNCDPKNRLSTVFSNNKFNQNPEVTVLDWLLSLSYNVDPAMAAGALVKTIQSKQEGFSKEQQKLLDLLKEISTHPRQRLLNNRASYRNSRRRYNRH